MNPRTARPHARRTGIAPLLLSLGAASAVLALPGCSAAVDAGGESTAQKGAALTDDHALPDLAATVPLPAGYGYYCSVVDPTNGGWLFTWSGSDGDPCGNARSVAGPGAVVARAGLWNENGNNYAMVRCNGATYYGITYGSSALSNIFNNAQGQSGCVFIISPAELPVWGPPIDYYAQVNGTSVFDYHVWGGHPWDIANFGMPGGDGNACHVDRTGYEFGNCANPSTRPASEPAPPAYGSGNEGAYDWSLPRDTPLRAVADGVVKGSQARTVWPLCGTDSAHGGAIKQSLPYSQQLEVFLETEVGTGEYAEHFVAAYHHMDQNPQGSVAAYYTNLWGGPIIPAGTVVKKGDIIGFVGESGCSYGGAPGADSYHLDFSVLRLTNLTGGRAYPFVALPSWYDGTTCVSGCAGVNGVPGSMDPFGWDAPQGVDPMSYAFIGVVPGPQNNQDPAITDPGTFSVTLWDSQRYGSFWFSRTPLQMLPHNGGVRY